MPRRTYRVKGTDRELSYANVVTAALEDAGPSPSREPSRRRRRPRAGKFRGAAVGSSAAFSYGAQVVEVSVDEDTGMIRSRRSGWRTTAASQSIRSRSKGRCRARCGWAWDRRCPRKRSITKGCRCARTCSTTECRRSSSRRRSRCTSSRARDPHGPFGAKEAGEGSLSGFLPALTNAIADAIGLRVSELPASPDRLLEAITARRRAERLRRTRTAAVAAADP